jgi:hypothetical protein
MGIREPYRSRFAAPHGQRGELKASVNNAALGDISSLSVSIGFNSICVRNRRSPPPSSPSFILRLALSVGAGTSAH